MVVNGVGYRGVEGHMTTHDPGRRSWRWVLPAVVVGLLVGGCVAAQPVVVKRPPPPPPLRVEIAPVAPSRAHVWVPGHWAWRREHYVWIPGHWEVPATPGYIWVPGGWRPRGDGYVWVDGHWRAR